MKVSVKKRSNKKVIAKKPLTNVYEMNGSTGTSINERSSGKTLLMEGQKEQALVRHHAFCAASDQSLDFLSHMSICRKHFSCFLHNLKKHLCM